MVKRADRNDFKGALKMKEAADYMGVSQDTIRQAIHSSGKPGCFPYLPAKMVGAHYLIAIDDLEEWFRQLPTA